MAIAGECEPSEGTSAFSAWEKAFATVPDPPQTMHNAHITMVAGDRYESFIGANWTAAPVAAMYHYVMARVRKRFESELEA